jgi:hypothetical protein
MQPATAQRIAQMLARKTIKAHGTRASYEAGCRCLRCRAAKSRYNSERESARRKGDTRDLVDAAAARAHIRKLSKVGVGYKSVADAAGISHTTAMLIRSGERTQLRQSTERRILAVDKSAIADRSLVPAGPSWKLLNQLIDEGYTRVQLAKWLGSKAKTPSLQLRQDYCTAKTALKVHRMFQALQAGKLRRD